MIWSKELSKIIYSSRSTDLISDQWIESHCSRSHQALTATLFFAVVRVIVSSYRDKLFSADAVNLYLHLINEWLMWWFQLKSTLQELQSSEMYSNNAEIDAAEARKSDLIAKKAKLDESLASARQFRALLQQQLQKAFQSEVGDQNTAQATIWTPVPILRKESEDRGRLRQYSQWFCSCLMHRRTGERNLT